MSKNIYQCNECNKTFSSYQALNGHKNVHSIKSNLYQKGKIKRNNVILSILCY